MLDELVEFNEYTCEINDDSPRRLKWGNITQNEFAGVKRALIIISRYAYYEKEMSIDAIKQVLNLWCGFEEDDTVFGINTHEEFIYIKGWLPKYIDSLLTYHEKKDGNVNEEKSIIRAKVLEKLRKKNKEWNESVFQNIGEANNMNKIYFDGIIAAAIDKGPLLKRYLVLKCDPKEHTKMESNVINDKFLKLIAAYLIYRIPDSRYSQITQAEYSNWTKEGVAEDKKIKSVYSSAVYTLKKGKMPKEIFNICYILNNDKIPMVELDIEWEKKFCPEIISEEKLKNRKYSKYYKYEDMGCSKPLIQIKNA